MNGTASTSILTGEPTDYEAGSAPETFHLLRLPRASWLVQVGVAAGSMTIALALTHALWRFVHPTPYFLGFLAAIVSSRVGGRQAGFLAAFIGVLG